VRIRASGLQDVVVIGVGRRREPLLSPDHRLDPYRRGVARAENDGEPIGYLLTRVQTSWTIRGLFWARRLENPRERPEWLLEYDVVPAWSALPFDDGIAIDEEGVADLLAEWDGNRHVVNADVVLVLRWLEPAEVELVT
jgi:hypothetical protein